MFMKIWVGLGLEENMKIEVIGKDFWGLKYKVKF